MKYYLEFTQEMIQDLSHYTSINIEEIIRKTLIYEKRKRILEKFLKENKTSTEK
jgi:hypothetical protein